MRASGANTFAGVHAVTAANGLHVAYLSAADPRLRYLLLLQGDSAQPILSCFVEEVSRQDDRLLDELERLVREKRREQEAGR